MLFRVLKSLRRNYSQPRSLITPRNILDVNFLSAMRRSLELRQIEFDLDNLKDLCVKYEQEPNQDLLADIQARAYNLPNLIHPMTPVGPPDAFKVIYTTGNKPNYYEMIPEEAGDYATNLRDKGLSSLRRHRIKSFQNKKKFPKVDCGGLNTLKYANVSCGSVQRTLYYQNGLYDLCDALISYTLDKLKTYHFQEVIVPEVIPTSILNAAGFPTNTIRSQVYKCSRDSLSNNDWCLIGTSEQALAAFCSGRHIDLSTDENVEYSNTNVHALCSVSKCFRQEVSTKESFLYRTHQFRKVEMFAVTQPNPFISDAMFMKMLKIQIDLFQSLNLHFRVIEMPTSELGLSAYRKIDIEAWMPGEEMFGEISSLSNCSDYQALRLNILTKGQEEGHGGHLIPGHTLNGTACAVPRLVKAILESNQNPDGSVTIPPVLVPFMRSKCDRIIRNDAYSLIWLAKMMNPSSS